MTKTLLISSFSLVILVLIWSISPVQAQNCNAAVETVTALYPPERGSNKIWEGTSGEGGIEQKFSSLLELPGNRALAVGERREKTDSPPRLLLTEFDERGRVALEKYYTLEGLENVTKILPMQEGFIILADHIDGEGGKTAWLGFFNKDRALISEKIIAEPNASLSARDIIFTTDGKGLVLAATAERKRGDAGTQKNAIIYLLDQHAEITLSRSYVAGPDNEILTLKNAHNHGYLAGGYLDTGAGRKAGWVLKLEENITLSWQQQYPRGLEAQIRAVTPYKDKYIAALGEVKGRDAGKIGGWLMMLDVGSGETHWQRYYTGPHHDYLARALDENTDGSLSLMMSAHLTKNNNPEASFAETVEEARPEKSKDGKNDTDEKVEEMKLALEKTLIEQMDYVHTLEISPRGETIGGEAYFNGRGARASQLLRGTDGRRLIAGDSDVVWKDYLFILEEVRKEEEQSKIKETFIKDAEIIPRPTIQENIPGEKVEGKTSRNGWVMIGAPPKPYTDPCLPRKAELP